MKGMRTISVLAVLAVLAVSGGAHALAWYFQTPASRMTQDIDLLHQYVMWVVIVIFIGVFGFMFWACYAHRKSIGLKAEQFHENTTVEILWTVIPAIILVAVAWPVTKVVIAQKNPSNPDLSIKVTGLAKAADDDTKAYPLNNWGNKTGEFIQPADIKGRRK